jgi:hypothetical protein
MNKVEKSNKEDTKSSSQPKAESWTVLELSIRWYTIVYILGVYIECLPRVSWKIKSSTSKTLQQVMSPVSARAIRRFAHCCAYLLQTTASLIALAGERAILYDLGATITSQWLVGRSLRKPFLVTTTIVQAEAEVAPVRDDGFLWLWI